MQRERFNRIRHLVHRKGRWTLVAALACSVFVFAACEVVIDPGQGVSISIANRLFTFTLGTVGQLPVQANSAPAQRSAVVPLFDGTPDDTPGSAALQLEPQQVDVIPLGSSRIIQGAAGLNGQATVEVFIGSAASTDPCSDGVDCGAFQLTFVDGQVFVADSSLELPFDAFLFVLTGRFTICLEVTATIDVDMTITFIDCTFGPIADTDNGCRIDDQCLDGFTCESGRCTPAPSSGCKSSDDCDAGEICTEGDCVTTPSSSDECTEDADCNGGEVCTDGQCVTVSSSDECTTDDDCDSGETCDGGTCVTTPDDGSCTTDNDCSAGQTCVDGACEDPAGLKTAEIIHRGSEQMVAKYEIDAADGVFIGGQYSVTQTALSGDGKKAWVLLTAQFPPEGELQAKLYSVNIDGSGAAESVITSDNLNPGSGQPVIATNLDGSVAIFAHGFFSTKFSRATPGSPAQLIAEDQPCSRSAIRLTDDGDTLVYSSFCTYDIYTLDVSGGTANATLIAPSEAFTANGQPLGSFSPGGTDFDISADGTKWLVQANFSQDGKFIPVIPLGTGLSGVSIANQDAADPGLDYIDDVNITKDGQTIGYCGRDTDDEPRGSCWVQDVGSGEAFEFYDFDGLTDIRRMKLAGDGSRVYVQTADNGPYGYFQTVGQNDRLIGGTGIFFSPAARIFINAELSDDGMTLAAPTAQGAYVLRDGVDGFASFPTIDGIQYGFDDNPGTMTVRAFVSPAGGIDRVILQPLYTGMEPTRVLPEEENPMFSIRFGTLLTETEEGSGIWEATFSLNDQKSALNSDYRLRVGAADTDNNRAVFQDFSPLP